MHHGLPIYKTNTKQAFQNGLCYGVGTIICILVRQLDWWQQKLDAGQVLSALAQKWVYGIR